MRQFIIARNADHLIGEDGSISSAGIRQMLCLGNEIKARVRSDSILILTSAIRYAQESAWALSEIIPVSVKVDPIFSQHGYFEEDIDEAWETILNHAPMAETVIVMTHIEFTQTLPEVYFREMYGVKRKFGWLETGCAYCLEGQRPVRYFDPRKVPRS